MPPCSIIQIASSGWVDLPSHAAAAGASTSSVIAAAVLSPAVASTSSPLSSPALVVRAEPPAASAGARCGRRAQVDLLTGSIGFA
jgi:hypothetical protein